MRLLTNQPREIEEAIRDAKDVPLRLASYANVSSLPHAADWPHGLVHVASLDAIAFCDGINWFPLVKGAAL